MDKQGAVKLLNETFKRDFDINCYIAFIKELFNHFELRLKEYQTWNEYAEYIDSYCSLGHFTDDSKKVIEVLAVKLKRTSSRDRARTMQRNFIAKFLSNTEKDSALVAFYGDDEDWRFSFVKMEYALVSDDKGKVKPEKELTPAKRYSFLVGKNEPNHTCEQQFVGLLTEDKRDPLIDEIEKAFSIEKVSKMFFEEYKQLYWALEDSLREIISKDSIISAEFEDKNISTVDFSKKLLGQIVFIYFLQKKGWLGVKVNEQWGTGPKDFLRSLFGDKGRNPLVPYNNFFNDILEPLFYEALATDRAADNHYYRFFNCKIPFLNGGLFEPINEYDWTGTEIKLDDTIFEGIFDTFDRFNFTVKEDEPLEKEVAVDPEMLGKVFENLLEVKDRKSKGAFYTPREIVHYMCQQSLINYLETNTTILREDIEHFVQRGDLALDQIIKAQAQKTKYQGKLFGVDTKALLPKSIEDNYELLDKLLKEIKVVDPAVGSGAFPVGMLNEIVKARSILSVFFKEERKNYDLKREIIENCLYGVDIEPSAVEIAKLRFWLSLIVDEDNIENIKPLPNLDHKIMCGNSLLEEFILDKSKHIKLFDERLLGQVLKDNSLEIKQIDDNIANLNKEKGEIARGKKGRSIKDVEKEIKRLEAKKERITEGKDDSERNSTLDESFELKVKESQKKLTELKRLQKVYFNEQNRGLKKQLREKIDKVEWELIEETLKEQGNPEAMQELEQYKKNKAKPFFLWKLYFAEVFQRENPGFDVVIGNPPYIEGRNLSADEIKMYKELFRSAEGKLNLFNLFQELSVRLLRAKGLSSFIVPSPFLRNERYWAIRKYLLENTRIIEFMTFKERQFESAIVENVLIFFQKMFLQENDILILKDLSIKSANHLLQRAILKSPPFKILVGVDKESMNLIDKLENLTVRLDSIYEIKDGISTGFKPFPEVLLGKKEGNNFILLNGKKELFNPKLHKRIIDGGEFNKYTKILWEGRYIKYDKRIEQNPQPPKGHPFNCQLRERVIFETSPRILSRQTSNRLIMTLNEEDYFVRNSVHNIYPLKDKDKKQNIKYILALLNSRLLNFYYVTTTQETGKIHPQVHISDISRLPIKILKLEEQKPFIRIVEQILAITKDENYFNNPDKQAKVKKLGKEIDQLVYSLYELTPEEIKIVEEFNER